MKWVSMVVCLGLLAPAVARAESWTGGQAEWARHGFRHGAWDCGGTCAGGAPPPAREPAALRMTLTCQQNLGDGRILVSDGRLLPAGARARILGYRPLRQAGGWSTGPCTVAVTR